MAKDISVNTQSGDLIVSENITQTAYWDVVWGKIIDSDESEYMNVVVPSGYINDVQLKDNKFECKVRADYYPVNSEFIIRLVVLNVVTNKYVPIQEYTTNAPLPSGAEYYPTYTGKPQIIMACQLPLVDIDGHFNIVFQQYSNNNFSTAIISSAKKTDFTIGNSDSQSAQLLARCAPGKFYRYPTTGLDLTKYINSVVEHTDMVESLVSQFKSDSKQITEAEFDSSTGDLQVVFSGTKEAEDDNLVSPQLLDIELFKIADDDFIRAAYKNAHSTLEDNSDFLDGLVGYSFYGLYDIGCSAHLDKISVSSIEDGELDGDGNVVSSTNNSKIATMKLNAGKMYAVDYDDSVIYSERNDTIDSLVKRKWYCKSLFAIYSDDGAMIYLDEPFASTIYQEYLTFKNMFSNRRCFIPLKDLTVKFYAGTDESWLDNTGFGIKPITDSTSNYNSILGLSADEKSGKLLAIASAQSDIDNIKIDITTNQILVIKQNT